MLSGEECLTTMVLRNSGQVDLTDLRVLVNSSSAIHIRGDATEIAEAAPMLVLSNDLADAVPVDLSLPANTLSAGAEFEVPVVLRGSTMGAVDLRWLFVFEVNTRFRTIDSQRTNMRAVLMQAGKGEYLTSRYAHRVQVDPVLDVAVHCRPSKSSDLAYTLSLEVSSSSFVELANERGAH